MGNSKSKKPSKEAKVVALKRSSTDWDKIINEAKDKEMTWKFMKDYFGNEVAEKEEE